jgi:hypothetical protein
VAEVSGDAASGPLCRPVGPSLFHVSGKAGCHYRKEIRMKNKLTDLNNHLFAQLERLSDEDLSGEKIAEEVKRADAVVAVADQIVRNADLQLKAVTILANHGARVGQHLTMLEDRQPPALAAVPQSVWCDQCEARVGPEEAARCGSAHCKAKAAA